MSIIRIIAVDPQPRTPTDDIVIYQVPENSRAHELLVYLFEGAGIEYTTLEFPKRSTTPRESGIQRRRPVQKFRCQTCGGRTADLSVKACALCDSTDLSLISE